MSKLRRPEKNSVHPLRLCEGRAPREVDPAAQDLIQAVKEGRLESLELGDARRVVEELEAAAADAANPTPVAVSTHADFADVVAGLRYVGPKKAQAWLQQQTALQIAEAKRLGQHRKEFAKAEWVPELYAKGAMTAEGVASYQSLLAEVFATGVAYLDGVEGLEQADLEAAKAAGETALTGFRAALVETLEGFDFAEQMRLMAKVISLQTLRRSQTFPAAHPGVLDTREPSAA